MTNELLALFEYYEKEKGIKRHTMIDALETALLSASRKSIGPAREMRIHIDPEKGDIRAYATLIVRDRVNNPYDEIDIFTARRLKPGYRRGCRNRGGHHAVEFRSYRRADCEADDDAASPPGGKGDDLRGIQGSGW